MKPSHREKIDGSENIENSKKSHPDPAARAAELCPTSRQILRKITPPIRLPAKHFSELHDRAMNVMFARLVNHEFALSENVSFRVGKMKINLSFHCTKPLIFPALNNFGFMVSMPHLRAPNYVANRSM